MDNSKNTTRAVILDAIRRAKRIARIDLAQSINISQATVTTITAEMIKQGLIEEIVRDDESAQNRRGRPRVDLRLKADAHLVAGLKVRENMISVVLVNFDGTVMQQHQYPRTESHVSPDTLIAQIKAALKETIDHSEYNFNDLSAVGVGISGMVDVNVGLVHWSPFLKERNLELGPMLSDALALPIFMDNDANLVAMAEQYIGRGQDIANFIVVTIEAGVGMGIVIDNQIYRGTRGCGAEFGHTKVELDGALCRCGQRGCLEAYVADFALIREAASINPKLVNNQSTEQSLQNILASARDGDETAAGILDRSSRIFAMGLANLVNLFDPELIILSGERMLLDHLYAQDMLETVKTSIVQVDAEPPEVLIHKWGDFMWAQGAASYALGGVAEMSVRDGIDRVA